MMGNVNIGYWTDVIRHRSQGRWRDCRLGRWGRWLIVLSMRLLSAGLTRQHVEATLIRYLISFLTIALKIVLVVAILGYFGLETTSFAALIGAAGVAIESRHSNSEKRLDQSPMVVGIGLFAQLRCPVWRSTGI